MELRKRGKNYFLRIMTFLINLLDLVLVRYSSIPVQSVNHREKIDLEIESLFMVCNIPYNSVFFNRWLTVFFFLEEFPLSKAVNRFI